MPMCRTSFVLFLLGVLAVVFSGCAVSASGNLLGEAAVTRFSTKEKKFQFVEAGLSFASSGKEYMSSPHHDVHYCGGSLAFNTNLHSFNYSLLGQGGGFFLSVPLTIPLDIGIRPSFVQWVGPLYFGAGVSFVGGLYFNGQEEDYEPEADDSFGRFDGFILYNFGGGAMFDVGKKFTLGAYANYERLALNSAGSVVKNYGFRLDLNLFGDDHSDENLPAYAKRVSVMTLGINAFIKTKYPLGFYAEYSPGELMYNDGWWKIRSGMVLLY